MKFRLFPQETAGLELLSSMAQQSVLAVQTLAEMFGARRADYAGLVEDLARIDSSTTEYAHSLLTELRTSFVNPLPREDLLILSENLQLAVERLGAVGELVHLHGLERLPRQAADLLEIVTREAELTVAAMRQLSNLDDLEDYWLDMTRLAKRAEHTYRVWSTSALREVSITAFARNIEVGRELLAAGRALRDVATYVGRIIVRES